ncbi:MAG: VTT domain-containing protein [Polaromonas sp.]|nr:VTT domain-containing protein [Polaromonas sp.]
MSAVSDLLLTGLLNYGNWLLGCVLFLAALGLPLPATMLLVATGAFARQGVMTLESAGAAALVGAVAGDTGSYLLGRFGAALLPARLQAATAASSAARLFTRWGAWAVFVSRFALTPVALPVNLLAGSTRLAWGLYMTAVLTGEVVWIALFGGLGYLFADRWEAISELAGDMVGILLGIAFIVAGVVAITVRHQRRQLGASR